ncbi:MAG: LexA family transcriptional regulator [Thermoprotei archaeon]|nr:MAG: LexA family transcriptional regulator [Thermoprotei archaeon]
MSRNKARKNNIGFLGPSTLRVYIELIKSDRPLGVRELQRKLKFKSPSTVKYHLDRLELYGLVQKTSEGYIAKSEKPSILSTYVSILGFIVPRILPFAVGLTVALIVYIIISYPIIDYGLLILATISILVLWVEGIRMYRWLKKILKV